jgi:methionyl-tRNA synthetase
MIQRYRGGQIPAPSGDGESLGAEQFAAKIQASMAQDYDPQQALSTIWDSVVRANRYVEETSPWVLSKAERNGDDEARQKLDTALYSLAETLRVIAVGLRPFLPETSRRIAEQLGATAGVGAGTDELRWGQIQPGTTVSKPQPIFPKLEAPVVES